MHDLPDGSGIVERAEVALNGSVRHIVMPLMAFLVLSIDQLSKGWIESYLPVGAVWTPFTCTERYFHVVHFTNTGAALGLFPGQSGLLALIAAITVVVVLSYAWRVPGDAWLIRLCMGLPVGGACGNLLDRLQQGHVTDFLLFTLPIDGHVLMLPAWNVADSAIVVGSIALVILFLRQQPARSLPPTRDQAV